MGLEGSARETGQGPGHHSAMTSEHPKRARSDSAARDTAPVRCPWCEAEDIERISEYGPELLVSAYLCLACRSPFEAIRKR